MSVTACQVCEATSDRPMCGPCADKLARHLGEFQSLMHEASMLATGQTFVWRSSTTRVGPDEELAELEEEYAHRMQAIPARLRSRDGRRTLPNTGTVVNLDARDLLADAYDTLRGQVEDIRDQAGTEPDGWADVVPWLLRNLENVIRWAPSAGSIHDELTYMHDRLERAVDRSPSRIYAGPCTATGCSHIIDPDSGQTAPRDLYAPWRPGSDGEDDRDDRAFTCDGWHGDGIGCGHTYTWASRRPWLIQELQTALVTISDFVAAMPDLFPDLRIPPQASFRGWVKNRLHAHGQDQATGEPTFVGSDVLQLVQDYKPHAHAPRPNRRAS